MDIFTLVGKIALDGADKAQQQLNGLEGYVKKNEKAFRAMGTVMTGFGAAITGVMALSVKAAAEEQAGIIKLTQALKNVGVAYDEVSESLEANIAATQTKTSIADDAQREALANLTAITGDYNRALELLPITLDLAKGKGMDYAAAADIVGRVSEGNTTILTRYGVQLEAGATATEALAELQAKYGGQAEAYGQSMAGQFDLLKNNIGDVMESIGAQLIPILTNLFQNTISPLIEKIKAWMAENPQLTKTIVIVAAAVGGLMMVLGPLLIILPGLTTAIGLFGAVMAIATGPVGLIIIGITALVAAGIALWQNWDKVVAFFKKAWANIKIFFLEGVKNVLESLLSFTSWLPWLGDKVQMMHDRIANMIEAEKVKKDLIQVEDALEDTTEVIKENTEATAEMSSALEYNRAQLELQKDKLKEQAAAIDVTTEAYKRQAVAATEAAEAQDLAGGPGFGHGGIEEGMSEYQRAYAEGLTEEEYARKYGGYQHGGLITQPTLLTKVGNRLPYGIMAEKGPEYIVPSGRQNVSIFVELDGRTIMRAIGQPLVDEIRLRNGIKI